MLPRQAKLPGFLVASEVATSPSQPLRPGSKAVLIVRLKVKPGYHIYAHEPGDRFLTATQLAPRKTLGLRFGSVRWPKPTRLKNALVHEGVVVVRIPFLVEPSTLPGAVALEVEIFAQGCNATDCFAPTRFSVQGELLIERP